jgi:L-lactate dehydrogenase complex protein LldE
VQISLFITCYNDLLFPETGRAIVRLLERLGHTVDFRAEQTCCGQMHYNTGYRRDTTPLVRKFVDIFEDADVVCAPSGSCVAMIRDHFPKVAREFGDPELEKRVAGLIPRVFEFTELIANKLGLEDVGAYYPHAVTYHPSCHSLRFLCVGDIPMRLLRKVEGIELIELPASQECCGFGGTFALKNAETSDAMLADKIRCVLDTGAEICSASDNSCLMHIGGALHRLRTGVRTVHIAEILASTREEDITK